MAPGLLIAAPSSGSGKTSLTLGLLRAFRDRDRPVSSIKVGPDYIDPAFHQAASGRPCLNLDCWAMRPETLADALKGAEAGADLILGEGVMGLFDGAAGGGGSTADLACRLGWPVVLLVDVSGMGPSVAALVEGYARHRAGLRLAGVVFNKVASARHEALLRAAVEASGFSVLGALAKRDDLHLPSRHLGLVQAGEHGNLQAFLADAAQWAGEGVDLEALAGAACPASIEVGEPRAKPDGPALPPLGQRIAVAKDQAFSFVYASQLQSWRRAGASLTFFSPLADQAPDPDADAVFLPGGYPELAAGRLAANRIFLEGLRGAETRGAVLYGECGGYMVLGKSLIDAQGKGHAMAGLLPLESSFAERCRHLGYRQVELLEDTALGRMGSCLRGHEFHYATARSTAVGRPWLTARDAQGAGVAEAGLMRGRVFGSFLHMIDRAEGRLEAGP